MTAFPCALLLAAAVAAGEPRPRVDAVGDPLPPGAVMRLGSARLRHRKEIYDLAFSADGGLLASASKDGFVCVWDAATGKELRRWGAPDAGNKAVAFSPDGALVAVGGADGVIRLF